MSDLIDRQAAIDEAKHYIEIGYDSDIIHTLENLPSAEPEIIRCKDCKHYDDGLCRRWKYSHVTSEDSFCSGAERRNGWEE